MPRSVTEYLASTIAQISLSGGRLAPKALLRVNEADTLGSLRGVGDYATGHQLDFTLVVDTSGAENEVLKYRFHFSSPDRQTLFRYDSAGHHRGLESFPHHKHVGAEEQVEESGPLDIDLVLREVRSHVGTGD